MNQLENKIILVTGANGFIGSHLVARLSKIAGVTLLLLSKQEQKSTQKNIIWLKGELEQLNLEYWQSNGISRIDYVFHLGAFTPKISIEANQINQIVDSNISGTRALLQSLPNKPIKLVFSSTLDVYAPSENGETLIESSRLAPNNLYGASKLFCESLLSVWAKECDCNYAILRYGHIYGSGEEQYGKLIPVVIRNLLNNENPIVYGDGSALRDYLYVGDAVEATIRAALVKDNIEAVNIVRGKSITLKEVVQLLISLVGNDRQINFLRDKPNGISLRFDNSLMIKLLGNWSMTSLEEGLAAEIKAFRRLENER